MEQKMKATDKLSWLEKISFSGGEMGTNLLFTVMSAYLLVYYTNYAHVNAAIVGTIMFVSKIFDAICDLRDHSFYCAEFYKHGSSGNLCIYYL